MALQRSYTFGTASFRALFALLCVGCSAATTQPATVPGPAAPQNTPAPAVAKPSRPPTSSGALAAAPPLPPIPPTAIGDIGQHVPTSFVAASPSGHWTVVCEASADTDNSGNLAVQVTQHGTFEGDKLKHVLYLGGTSLPIDDYAGSDPSGRHVAVVKSRELHLINTGTQITEVLHGADTRATQASYESLRSVAFSDDGKWLAYARGNRDVTVRNLETGKEASYTIDEPKLYRLRFAAGGRFLVLEVLTTDSNKNGKLTWLVPERTEAAACPSPVPSYNVWQYPGDTPETRLLDVKTGNLITPQGFALAAGNIYVERAQDLGLLVHEPGKPVRNLSSKECAGRVMHVDVGTGNVVVGCASAWGQRRQIFLRTVDARIALNFDLAAYELDTRLDTHEANIAFYPGNQTLVFNTRTRERWPLVDGTQVLTISGNTALIEHSQKLQLIKLKPDASNEPLTNQVPRPAFSGLVRQGGWVSVGNEVFELERGEHKGAFPSTETPLALSNTGQGLYLTRPATPALLGGGPLRWVNADERH